MITENEFKIKINELKNNESIKNLIIEELSLKNDRCDFKTYLNFHRFIIPFFEEEFEEHKADAVSYIFKEDIFDICEDREEDFKYFKNCIKRTCNKELSCSTCNNKSACDSKFGPKTDLKRHLIVLKFVLDSYDIDNEDDINETVESFTKEITSMANKKELLGYLCSDFIDKYFNCDNWNLNIAKLLLRLKMFNNDDFKIVKDYHSRKSLLKNACDDNYNNLINESPALKELHKMIGLKMVKEQMEELYDLLCFKKLTEDKLILPEMTLNCTFEGNPGTGKTRTAKLYAKLLYQTGFIKTDKLTCVSASDLISDHIGGTAIKTTEIIQKSLGGVLFIDEAYQLTPSCEKDFGKECIATLVREMTEHKNDLVIIFAGYKKEMQEFINVNPGMKSRITNRISFEDYSIDELYEIFKLNSNESKFNLSDDVEPILKSIFKEKSKDKSFGNARFVENLFQEVLIKHSRNTMRKIRNKEIKVDSEEVKTIDINDIPHNYTAYTKKELNLENIPSKKDLSNAV